MNMSLRRFVCLSVLSVFCNSFQTCALAEGSLPIENAAEQKNEQRTPFDFDYYEDLMQPVPDKERKRLCGLDKICVELWQKQKMHVYKEGRLFTGDFNSDGITDEAVILEGEEADDPDEKVYYIYISSKDKDKGERKLWFHEVLPDARNVVDVFFDKDKNALVIDTGGRVVRTESATTSVGASGSGYTYSTGKVRKVVIVVLWNPKNNTYELLQPGEQNNKRKHLYK